MKTTLKAIAVVALMLCIASVAVTSDSESDGTIQAQGNVGSVASNPSGNWVLEDGTLTITMTNSGTTDLTKIPDNHRPWSGYADSVYHIVIKGYTYLGTSCFYEFNNVIDITSNSVVEIGYQSCYSCDNLTTVTLPGPTLKTYYETFRDCTKLQVINFQQTDAGGNITATHPCDLTINDGASRSFYNCQVLERIGDGTSYKISGKLGDSVFSSCKKLFNGATLDMTGVTYLGNSCLLYFGKSSIGYAQCHFFGTGYVPLL